VVVDKKRGEYVQVLVSGYRGSAVEGRGIVQRQREGPVGEEEGERVGEDICSKRIVDEALSEKVLGLDCFWRANRNERRWGATLCVFGMPG